MEENLLKFINKKQIASVMNKTKWQKLADAISGINPMMRIKYVLDEELFWILSL